MTKKELLESEGFKNAPMDAYIEIPNWHYEQDGDYEENATPTSVKYWEFRNQINIF